MQTCMGQKGSRQSNTLASKLSPTSQQVEEDMGQKLTKGRRVVSIKPTPRRKDSREYAYDKCEERIDPYASLPAEIFVQILSNVHVKDVAAQCSLVSRGWYEACGTDVIWKLFIWNYDESMPRAVAVEEKKEEGEIVLEEKKEQEHVSEERAIQLVNEREQQEQGLEMGENAFPTKKYPRMSAWKKYFAWKASYHVRWQPEDKTNSYHLTVSEDGKCASMGTGKSAHANAWGTEPFSKGIHRWSVKVDGLNSNGFWCALGVVTKPHVSFRYDSKGEFTGYSGAGDIFSIQGEKTQGTARRWKNGDVITMYLDCNNHLLHVWINKEKQPSLPTLHAPLWPWANGYVAGCSLTIVPTLYFSE